MTETTNNAPSEADELRAQVLHAEETLKAAEKAHYAAVLIANGVRYNAQAPAHDTLEALKARFAERAHELAIEANKCPHTRSGSHMDPDRVSVQERGICLSWDINGNYAPDYFVATWEALTAPTSSAAIEGEDA